MKTILCYGDSNTWGFNGETGGRFSWEARWTGVLQRELGERFRVMEEGLNGRTAGMDDPTEERPWERNGALYLYPCLRSHYPVDCVVLMLGTNDLKTQFFTTAADLAARIEALVAIVREILGGYQGYLPEILLISPPQVGERIAVSPFSVEFGGEKSIGRSKELADAYRRIAQNDSCAFFNAAELVKPGEADSIHLTREGHRILGLAVAGKIREILG